MLTALLLDVFVAYLSGPRKCWHSMLKYVNVKVKFTP